MRLCNDIVINKLKIDSAKDKMSAKFSDCTC